MEVVDTRLKELDGKQVTEEEISELAEEILCVKKARSETPQLYQAACQKLLADKKLLETDEELIKMEGKPVDAETEIKDMRKGDQPKLMSLKEKMKKAAQENGLKKKAATK